MTKEEALVKVKGCLIDSLPTECADEIDEIINALQQDQKWFVPIDEDEAQDAVGN